MINLNKLEFSILARLSNKYPEIKKHIPYLKVLNRDNTGVGMYVNFLYANDKIVPLSLPDSSISTNENIEIKGLKYGLGYEVDISKGRLNFIEFITYGEKWDGKITDFMFSK
ncbi:MAG: hypothetical protein WAM28_02995 [Chlamydiales bacterium]